MRTFAGPLIISGKGCWHCVRPLVCLIFVIIIIILTCYKNNGLTSMKLKPPGVLFFYRLKGLYYCNYSPYFKPNHYNVFINRPSVVQVLDNHVFLFIGPQEQEQDVTQLGDRDAKAFCKENRHYTRDQCPTMTPLL